MRKGLSHLISSKAAKRYGLTRDEGGTRSRGEVPQNELNHPTNQGGGARYGRRVSKGAGAGRERQPGRDHIDAGNGRKFPAGAQLGAEHNNTHWLTRFKATPRSTSSQSYGRDAYMGDRPSDAATERAIARSAFED